MLIRAGHGFALTGMFVNAADKDEHCDSSFEAEAVGPNPNPNSHVNDVRKRKL